MDAPLHDRYIRYKSGTKYIVRWLLSQAHQRNDLTAVLPRLANPNAISTTISVHELLRLAQAVEANSSGDREAPPESEDIIKILRSVIADRKEFGTWYYDKEIEGNCEGNSDSHLHFIDTLQKVLDALRNAVRRSRQSPRKLQFEDLDVDTIISNIYTHLEADGKEYSEVEGDGAASSNASNKTKVATATARGIALETSRNEPFFALWACLAGCHAIGKYIVQQWEQWASGDLSIETAARVTDMAFGLIQCKFVTLTGEYPGFDSPTKLLKDLNISVSTTDGVLRAFTCDESGWRDKGSSTATADQLLCIPTLCELLGLQAICKATLEGTETALEGTKAYVSQCCQLTRSVLVYYNELQLLKPGNQLSEDLLGCDILTNELHDFLTTGNLSTQRLVIYDIYRKVHDVVYDKRSSVNYAAHNTVDSFRKAKTALEQNIEQLRDEYSYEMDLPSYDGSLTARACEALTDMYIDRQRLGMNHHAQQLGFKHLFAHFPLLTGLTLAKIMEITYVKNVHLCVESHYFLAAAHLYRACSTCGHLEPKEIWEDMEFAITHLGKKGVGILMSGIFERSALRAARGYALSFGASLISRERTGNRNNEVQRIRLPAKMTEAALKRKREGKVSEPLLQQLLDHFTATKRFEPVEPEMSADVIDALLRRASERNPGHGCELLRKQWQKTKKLTPIELLEVYKTEREACRVAMNFDYDLLLTKCAHFLLEARDNTIPLFHIPWPEHGFPSPDQEMELRQVPDEILWRAALDSGPACHLLSNNSGPLGVAAGLARDIIEHDGDEHILSARARLTDSLVEESQLRNTPMDQQAVMKPTISQKAYLTIRGGQVNLEVECERTAGDGDDQKDEMMGETIV